MRIHCVSRHFWPSQGGIETWTRQLATHLLARHEVRVLAQRVDDGRHRPVIDTIRRGRWFEPFVLDSGLPVEPLTVSLPRRVAIAPLVVQASARLRGARSQHGRVQAVTGEAFARVVGPAIARQAAGADVLQVMVGAELAAASVRAGELLGVPVVIDPSAHHGQWDDDAGSATAYRRADLILAKLEADAAVYRDLGVPETRLAVGGLRFTEPPQVTCSPEELRARHGIDGELVVFVGARRSYKGLDVLLEAAGLVARERPGVTYAFVGPGPALSPPPAGVRVLDVGPVCEEDKASWLAAADLLCLPSAAESFGLVVLEAWSVATPVLVSRIPALTELVERGGGGEAVPREPAAFAAAIGRLLADPERRRALGETGARYWARHGRPEVVVRRYEALYEQVVAEHARAAVA